MWILLDTVRPRQDNDQDAAGQQQDALLAAKDGTIADLRAHVGFLERELERGGDEANTLHRIVAGLTQANTTLAARMPELEAPQEAPEDAETVEEAPEGSEPRSGAVGAQEATEGAENPGFWRRLFGG